MPSEQLPFSKGLVIDGKVRCGARRRGTNEPWCMKRPMGNKSGRCRLHGGKSLRGVEAPAFKNGRYAKDSKAVAQKVTNAFGDVYQQSIASWSNGDPMEEKTSMRGEHFVGGTVPDHLRCCARSKQSGERCRKYRRSGRKVCYLHGGKSLSEFIHPQYIHGQASKSVVDLFRQWQQRKEITAERFDFIMDYHLTNLLAELIEAHPVIRANGLDIIERLWRELANIRIETEKDKEIPETFFKGLLTLIEQEQLLGETVACHARC